MIVKAIKFTFSAFDENESDGFKLTPNLEAINQTVKRTDLYFRFTDFEFYNRQWI